MWTICLQLPAILVGWLLGNLLGALAADIRKGFEAWRCGKHNRPFPAAMVLI